MLNINFIEDKDDIEQLVDYLRDNNYPRPDDCNFETCEELRPACKVGICKIATELCGDF